MDGMSRQDSKRMYSWLWDSHISPKNSKWLQENLADIDSTVKQMIRIIEEDGDSFARRAEMYYKKRPELMRLVEQFYRAYRGLAERYSHATGVIRQAHHTMAEAFPGQVPPLLSDDSSARVVMEHCVSGMQALFGAEEVIAPYFAEEGKERKVLNFRKELEKDMNNSLSKEYDENLGAEKECIIEKLSALESRLIHAEEELRQLKEQARKAGAEVCLLEEALKRLEAEKEAAVIQYEQCVERISSLESELSGTVELHESDGEVETQVQTLKNVLVSEEAAKETILAQHSQCAVMISSLQKRLLNAEDVARRIGEREREAEDEVERLRKEIAKLEEEKKVSSLVYWQSIDKLSSTQAEVVRLDGEIMKMNEAVENLNQQNLSSELSIEFLQSENKELRVMIKKLDEEKAALQKSIFDLSGALEKASMEALSLEKSFHSIAEEKLALEIENAVLLSLAEGVNYEAEQLSRNNVQLESSLIDARSELRILRHKSSNIKSSLQSLDNEKTALSLLMEESEFRNNALQKEKEYQQIQVRDLLGQVEMLREGMIKVSRTLVGDADGSFLSDEARVKLLLHKVEELKQKNELLVLEKSVLVMLFGQLRMDASEAEKEREALLANLNVESEKLTALQNEAENLLQMNDLLRQKESERIDNEEQLKTDIKALKSKITELQGSKQNLQTHHVKVLQENACLGKDLLQLKQKNHALEDENCMVLVEALSLSNISLVCNEFVAEKTIEVAELAERVQNLEGLKNELERTVGSLERDLEAARAENTHLSVSVQKLDEELTTVKTESDQLAQAVANGKDILHEKNSQLHEVEKNLVDNEKEKELLASKFEVLKRDYNKVQERQDAQILKLSSDNSREIVNNKFLHKMVNQLETELVASREQCEETRARERALSSEIETWRKETDLGKFESEALLSKLLMFSVEEAVFTEKIHDLADRCQELDKEKNSKGENVQLLKERVCCLESENVGLKAQLDTFTTQKSDVDGPGPDPRTMKEMADASYVDSDKPKDITLDQTSKKEYYGSSRTDDRMLELWEIGSEGQSIDLTVSKGHKPSCISEIIPVNEELEVVDKLEVSKRFIDSYHEENKRKVIEKLESDGLKLTNLRITVQDLMTKVEITETTKRKNHDIEYNTVKEQLEEAEEAITKLCEMNAKLKKAVLENSHKPSIGKSQSEFEHAWSLRRQKILDHAQRGAERLGRLQLEVQKLQFLLLKLDVEKEKKLKTRMADPGPKFLLKDYLNGRGRSVRLSGQNQSKKKNFCGCIHPPTKGD